MVFQSDDFERPQWRLFQKIFFNIYVCHKVADIGIKGHIMKIPVLIINRNLKNDIQLNY
jgi:hypothetical protein